jgi:hypothetical protein
VSSLSPCPAGGRWCTRSARTTRQRRWASKGLEMHPKRPIDKRGRRRFAATSFVVSSPASAHEATLSRAIRHLGPRPSAGSGHPVGASPYARRSAEWIRWTETLDDGVSGRWGMVRAAMTGPPTWAPAVDEDPRPTHAVFVVVEVRTVHLDGASGQVLVPRSHHLSTAACRRPALGRAHGHVPPRAPDRSARGGASPRRRSPRRSRVRR